MPNIKKNERKTKRKHSTTSFKKNEKVNSFLETKASFSGKDRSSLQGLLDLENREEIAQTLRDTF